MKKNILNKMMLENNRKNPLYQSIITDLAILGYIQTQDAEMLLGYKIPSFLKTPDGQFLSSVNEAKETTAEPVKKEAVKEEKKAVSKE